MATVAYTSAKVALVGDTGVGKSGLALTLTGQAFEPTDSTHGRRVVTFALAEVETEDGAREIREALLWDLAGQPGYRLIHQLHLHELALALVVFDARSETDPFAGVRHWDRALRQAKHSQGSAGWPLKKLLIEARIDRTGVGASAARIESIVRDLGFDGYFRTSAREGLGIQELALAIRSAISWAALPKASSTELFGAIRSFVVGEKESGRLLAGLDDLYRAFERSEFAPDGVDDLRAQFETCIRLMEAHDIIRRLSFGSLILLQPEMLDAYASALVNAAREEPDGLGSIAEEDARAGRFSIPAGVPPADDSQVKLLLIAMVEDLLRFEIALREQAEDGPYLVFPSQLTRERPDLPDPPGKALVFSFEGPIGSVYATLAVRLSHSGTFERKEMWKNAAVYTVQTGGTCGLFLREIDEGRGELVLFFDDAASAEARALFSAYVYAHLRRRALPDSVERRLVPVCSECGLVVTDQQLQILRGRGQDRMTCPACQNTVWLVDRVGRSPEERQGMVQAMDTEADAWRQRDRAASIIVGKRATHDFDVFLSHNSRDKTAALELRERLLERGILPWIDAHDMPPFARWQDELELIIRRTKSAAVLVGPNGMGPWEDMEVQGLLIEFVRRRVRIGLVRLPGCPDEPEVPFFLNTFTWVDMRDGSPEALDRLIWGITGERAPLFSQPLVSAE